MSLNINNEIFYQVSRQMCKALNIQQSVVVFEDKENYGNTSKFNNTHLI